MNHVDFPGCIVFKKFQQVVCILICLKIIAGFCILMLRHSKMFIVLNLTTHLQPWSTNRWDRDQFYKHPRESKESEPINKNGA